MKVIGFIGSPRIAGNTAWVVNKIIEGANEKGAETQVCNSSELDIKPCKGCLSCVSNDRCIINDDMQKIYDAIIQADALVLGSPIYMGQMTAQAKTFMDRLFAQITPRFSPKFKEKNAGKKLVLAFTQGNPDSGKFQTYYDYTKHIFQLLEFKVKDVVVVAGTRNEIVSERKELHAAMKNIGSLLVSE
jgi:multimeric flavodoxin WrbA